MIATRQRFADTAGLHCAFVLAAVLLGAHAVPAQSPTEPPPAPLPTGLEYRVKGSFVLAFAKYVQWPAPSPGTATNTLVIGVLGPDPFTTVLQQLATNKTVAGRPVVVREVRPEALDQLHLLYVGAGATGNWANVLAPARAGLLTISDQPGFLKAGGHIQLVPDQGRIGFEVNLPATQTAGFKLDANLLRVARKVWREHPGSSPP